MENVNDTHSQSKIEEIKKIIFGEEIKSYNGEIENLRKSIEGHRSEISVKIDEVKIELLKSIEAVEQGLLNRVMDSQNQLKQEIEHHRRSAVSKNSLSNVFDEISKSLAQ